MAIGSRTKGITETKRFNGNVVQTRTEILDTSYIQHRYYNIAFIQGRPIQSGSVHVYRDDLNPATDNPAAAHITSAEDFAVPAQTYPQAGSGTTGFFDELREGIDYSLDLSRGLVILTRDAGVGDALAVEYVFNDDGTTLSSICGGAPCGGLPKIIKAPGDVPLGSEDPAVTTQDGFKREVKTFYSIGQTKIVPDDGRGSFLFSTEDLNRLTNAVFLNNGQQLVHLSPNLEVDFTQRALQPRHLQRHRAHPGGHDHPDPLRRQSRAQVLLRRGIQSHKKVTYNIKPNLVFGSEHVTMNGRTLTRDVDYFVDYDSGYLTFFNDDQIDDTTQIEVTHEYAPFGGQLGETLVGTREELDLVPGRFKVGCTFMCMISRPSRRWSPTSAPRPGASWCSRPTASSRTGRSRSPPATLNLQAEVAKSKEDPNLYGKAIVDSMEGVKQEAEAVLGPEAWMPAANPNPLSDGVGRPDSLWTGLSDEQLRLRDINPAITSTEEDDKIRVLTMSYSLGHKPGGTGPEIASLVQTLSKSGLDFSKKVTMELWVQGAGVAAGQGVDMCVNVGEFNEDADGSGILKTEDKNLDGTLNFGEDAGWRFNNPGDNGLRNGDVVVGAGNGRLDSEDYDGDGSLRRADVTPRGSLNLFCLNGANSPSAAHANDLDVRMVNPATGADDKHSDLAFDGWRLITVPLNISADEAPNFQAIKQVRLTMVNDIGAAPHEGTIRLAKVSFVGTTWETPDVLPIATASTMTLSAVNNIDNPEYNSLLGNPAYNDLYKDEATGRTREQALQLSYDLANGSTATTREVYTTALDFLGPPRPELLPADPGVAAVGRLFAADRRGQLDRAGHGLLRVHHPLDGPLPGHVGDGDLGLDRRGRRRRPGRHHAAQPPGHGPRGGQPELPADRPIEDRRLQPGRVQELVSQLWVNEIHVVGSRKKEGNAQRFAADLLWPSWGTVGAHVRGQDKNFETLTAQVLNQDKQDEGANFALSRLRWLPLSGNVAKSQTVTPAVFRTGDAGLVSLLSEGREETVTGRGTASCCSPTCRPSGFPTTRP